MGSMTLVGSMFGVGFMRVAYKVRVRQHDHHQKVEYGRNSPSRFHVAKKKALVRGCQAVFLVVSDPDEAPR